MRRKVLFSITAIPLLIVGISVDVEAVRPQETRRPDTIGDLTGRDAVGFRKDKVTKESVGERPDFRPPSTKQAMQDFREIQELNLSLKRASKESPLAFEGLVATAKRMGVVANRLNALLVLPKPKQKPEFARAETPEEFQQQIEDMNSNVKAFVTNPIFRQLTDSTRDLPREAGENLGKVIALSKSLEEGALKLSGKN
jgi:hypothetical protein